MVLGHVGPGHFDQDISVLVHSAMDHFGLGSFRPWDFSVHGHFGPVSFRYGDIAVPGHFGTVGDISVLCDFDPGTFQSLVIPSHFGNGTLRFLIISAPGYFGP